MTAKLYFHYSTMNAGKSTALLQVAHNYHERGMDTVVFSGSGNSVESRIGIFAPAERFDADTDFWGHLVTKVSRWPPACILIDEAQFLTEHQVHQLEWIVDDKNIPVMCYGLRTDFLGTLFPGSAALLARADILTEIKTICHCGRKATMVIRVTSDGRTEVAGNQIEIGGMDRYVSLCRKHWYEAMRNGAWCQSPVGVGTKE